VSYRPSDTGEQEQAAIFVDLARYERARLEDQVELRYMPAPDLRQLGSLAAPRLADQPRLGQLRAQLGASGGLLLGAALWLAVLAVWAKWRP
jgi:hypothetical protein